MFAIDNKQELNIDAFLPEMIIPYQIFVQNVDIPSLGWNKK